jgi:chromosome segregation protein
MGRLDNAVATLVGEVDVLRRGNEEHLGAITRLHSKMAGVEQRLRAQRARADILERERSEALAVLADGQGRLAGVEEALAEADAETTARRNHLADLEAELEGRKGAWAAMSTTLDELESLVREREARRLSLREILEQREGFDAGVREVMRLREGGEGDYRILGTVSDVVEVSPQYEQAIEAALSEALQYILVQTQEDCIVAIADLDERGAGRTSFVPLDSLRAPDAGASPRGRGVVAEARDIVRAAEPHGEVVEALLGDVTIVEDLRAAVRLWNKGCVDRRLVTLDGDSLARTGVVSGGARVEGGVLGQKRELRHLESELADLGAQTAEGRAAIKRISEAMHQVSTQREQTRSELHELDVRRAGILSELQAVRREVGAASRRLVSLDEERELLAPASAEIEEEQRRVQAAVAQAEGERDAQREQVATLERRVLDLRAERDARRSEAFEARLEATAARERLDSVRQRLSQLAANRADVRGKLEQEQAERTRLEGLVTDHERRVRARAAESERLAREIEAEGVDLAQAIQNQERAAAERRTLEAEVRELRTRAATLDEAIQDVSSKVAVLNAEITHLADGLHGDFGLDLKRLFGELETEGTVEVALRGTLPRPLDEGQPDEPVEAPQRPGRAEPSALAEPASEGIRVTIHWEQLLDGDALAQRREQLIKTRSDLDRIGEINMGAPEAYEEVRSEHGKLRAQMDDLEASIESIRRGIAKLNRESRERFGKAFAEVNRHFQELYPRLNGGGKAFLALTDPDDLLETGVEVNVQPPGKKLKAMGLLSGGEKAMAAISLLFAVFLHRPSPFCLLDEVDAELDEANVRRVCQLLREMSERTQFIVITHKRLTMETADMLFGVTMERAGVSKLVTVKLEDVA